MSMITENTVMVAAPAEQSMLNDLKEYGCDGIYKVYQDGDVVIYNFDCNGDSPWDILNNEDLELDWDSVLALETNYGDGNGYWTRIRSDDGYMIDIEETLAEWLDKFHPGIYASVAEKIKYTF